MRSDNRCKIIDLPWKLQHRQHNPGDNSVINRIVGVVAVVGKMRPSSHKITSKVSGCTSLLGYSCLKEALHFLIDKQAVEKVLVHSSLVYLLQQVVSDSKTKQMSHLGVTRGRVGHLHGFQRCIYFAFL